MQTNSREQLSALTAYQTKAQETLELCQEHRCSNLDTVTSTCTGNAVNCPLLPRPLDPKTETALDFKCFVENM